MMEALAHTGEDAGAYHMMGWFDPWGIAGVGGVGMLLFWIAILIGIVLLVKWLSKGEIDAQEFEKKKKDLL